MSNLSFMEKLLDGVEVAWMALGEVAEYSKSRVGSNLVNEENYVGVDNLLQNRAGKTKSSYVPTEGRLIEYLSGDVLIGNIRPYLKKIWHADRSGGTNGDVLVIRPTHKALHSGYLYQVLTDENFFAYNMQHAKGAKMPRGDKAKIFEYILPIPCPENPKKSLEIQAEIVRILDAFTAHTAELTAELTARKKQYNYYRERLILNSGAKSEKLEDISKIYLGLTYTPTYVDKGVKFISAQNTSGDFLNLTNVKYISEDEYKKSTSNAKPKRGDVLFTRVGSNLGHPVIVDTDEQLCIFVSLGFIRVNPEKVLNSYIKHWMNTDLFWEQVRKNVHGSAKVNLNTGWLNKFDVLLPSIPEQTRIVSILDKFDALTSSITEGLPREIELRQKQYEYYRDLLLSFPKPEQIQAAT